MLLKEVHASDKMVLNIFRPGLFVDTNAVFHGPSVHHQERHDGVVVGRGGQFHLPACSQFTVHGHDVTHVVVLCIEDIRQVAQGVISVLHEQGDEAVVPVVRIVIALHVIRGELVEVPQDLQVKEILRCEQLVVHDGVRFEVVERHIVELLVPSAGRVEPAQFFIALRDVVNPTAVPERLELHRVKFQSGGVWITALAPRTLGDIGVDVERLVEVVINELLNERRHEIVGDLGVGLRQDAGRINVLGHGVDTNPRHLVHAGQLVLVIRLMLVEHNGEVQGVVNLVNAP